MAETRKTSLELAADFTDAVARIKSGLEGMRDPYRGPRYRGSFRDAASKARKALDRLEETLDGGMQDAREWIRHGLGEIESLWPDLSGRAFSIEAPAFKRLEVIVEEMHEIWNRVLDYATQFSLAWRSGPCIGLFEAADRYEALGFADAAIMPLDWAF